MMEDELNIYGVCLLDVYMLDYCGVKVFFQVCRTRAETVFLTELATKKTKYGIMLCSGLGSSKKPLVVTEGNTHTKSRYEVKPIRIENEYWLPIEVKPGDPLYLEALKFVDCPPCGHAYAVPVGEVVNRYWEEPKPLWNKEEVKGFA